MTPYTPPEPFGYVSHIAHVFLNVDGGFVRCESQQSKMFDTGIFSEAQLRSEVERVRRETVEECAVLMESQYIWLTIADAAKIIRSLK